MLNMLADVGMDYLDFSKHSFKDGHCIYLEEDSDMEKFLLAHKAKHNVYPAMRDMLSLDDSFIRELPRNPV